MDVDGISIESATYAGADDVDDAGLWDEVVVEGEGALRAIIVPKSRCN